MRSLTSGRRALTTLHLWSGTQPARSKSKDPRPANLRRGAFSCLVLLVGSLTPHTSSHRFQSPPAQFSHPQKVTLRGYSADAMEPFLTRDGNYLFFNNSNDPHVNTNLHWAERVDDLTFQYKGEIGGVNTRALEAVASLDRNGVFYFVSNRSYHQTAATIYRGTFAHGSVSAVELAPGVSSRIPGLVNFDAEISADGNALYYVESQFSLLRHRPKTAKIAIARRAGNSFRPDPESDTLLREINTGGLDYAPATSPSELEIFFTRLDRDGPAIYTATRSSTAAAFGAPEKIRAITGFAEGPTVSPDGTSLYYQRKEDGKFVLYRVTR